MGARKLAVATPPTGMFAQVSQTTAQLQVYSLKSDDCCRSHWEHVCGGVNTTLGGGGGGDRSISSYWLGGGSQEAVLDK